MSVLNTKKKKYILSFSAILMIFALNVTPFSPSFAGDDESRTAGTKPEAKSEQDYSETYQELSLFGDVFERVRAQYVEKVDDKKLIELAIRGMLTGLDPHSDYLDEDRFNDMKVQTKGEFGGLGIEVSMESGLVKVVSPIDDTPASKAGILAGDYITKIDGEAVMGLTLNDAVDKMRGKVGTKIDLEIRRKGVEGPINIALERAVIRIHSVRSHVEGNTGYIRITTFSQSTTADTQKAIEDIKKQLGPRLNGYVIDLRNNPGGLLDQAIGVSDIFLDKGEIVSTRGRNENDTKRDNATPGDMADGLPIVVIINGGTASAAEIVSGALQDHKRAILMGTRSFGKGSVQTVMPIPGHGALRLTTARYYTPSGRSIQAEGIEPDIVVEQAKLENYEYERIRESDLHGALKNEHEKEHAAEMKKVEEERKKALKKDKPEDSSDKTDNPDENGNEETPQDYQLQRALDMITALSLYHGVVAPEAIEKVKTDETVKQKDKEPGK